METLGAELHLERRFLTRDVQRGVTQLLQPTSDLQQQSGFADAGLAANENHRAGDDATAQYKIAFLDSGFEPDTGGALDVAKPLGENDRSTLSHRLRSLDAPARSAGRRARRR